MKKVLTLFVLSVLSVCILGACSQSRSKTYEGDIEQIISLTNYEWDTFNLHRYDKLLFIKFILSMLQYT
jgi:uncharacterized lipoprotein YehR (DUF1307 family)